MQPMHEELFDEGWYRGQMQPFEGDAWSHFVAEGWQQGYDPHPLFSIAYYLSQRPVLEQHEDPLTHYFRVGAEIGLSPHGLFDPVFYCTRYAEFIEDENPFVHFLTIGREQRLDPNEFFDVSWYKEFYEDIRRSEFDPFTHYATYGKDEWHRQPHPLFDPFAYALRLHLQPGTHPLIHFLERYRDIRARNHFCERPDCSVIILNFNKALLTIQCVVELLDSSDVEQLEVIVVDNGSSQEDFRILAAGIPTGVLITRLQANRYFGEGNNIGIDDSRGRYILFLNNDAFVERETYARLRAIFNEYGDAGAAGPKFLYPDGRIQEAGARISECGLVTQRGKGLENERGRYEATEVTDYISAACLMVPRSVLDDVAGFDLAWEPAYYEDVDLCLKISLLGLKTYYCGTATVRHIENATSGDAALNLGLNNIVEINREKFIARWAHFVHANGQQPVSHVALPAARQPRGARNAKLAVLFTPYSLVPGGGERYILSIAQELSQTYRTVLVTPERYSTYRLRTLGADLELDLSAVELVSQAELAAYGHCDLFIAIGNEALPALRGIGKRRIYVCQFPFPMHVNHAAAAWNTLKTYDTVVVYSDYVAHHFIERAKLVSDVSFQVVVLPPCVPQVIGPADKRNAGRILHVGRFTPDGHAKRQDVLLAAFRKLYEECPSSEVELHFVGTIPADAKARAYFTAVRDASRGLPVSFHINAPADVMIELYTTSSFYWHSTGFGQSERYNPQRFEHFGISVVEAMSAGAIPFVYDAAGPAEIVVDGANGYHWHTVDDLVATCSSAFRRPPAELNAMRSAARKTARQYDVSVFNARLAELIGTPSTRSMHLSAEIDERSLLLVK